MILKTAVLNRYVALVSETRKVGIAKPTAVAGAIQKQVSRDGPVWGVRANGCLFRWIRHRITLQTGTASRSNPAGNHTVIRHLATLVSGGGSRCKPAGFPKADGYATALVLVDSGVLT